MDDIDRKILAELQRDGRLTVTELSERIGLSLSPCQRRLRALEQDKVISGYRAAIDPVRCRRRFSLRTQLSCTPNRLATCRLDCPSSSAASN